MPRECDLHDCQNTADVRACRDPDGNLLDLCGRCRREWPVEEVER